MTEDRPVGPVRSEIAGDIGIIRIDSPPVNALGAAVRAGLMAELDRLNAASGVKAIVLTGTGQTFSAGADIREFGAVKAAPQLGSVTSAIARNPKPVIAAITGHALGGGLELALACRARVAHVGSSLGLPEVKLGLIPGAGGTVRLPAILGGVGALDFMMAGNPVSAARALEIGLVDQVTEGDPVEAVIAAAAQLPARAARSTADAGAFDADAAKCESKFQGQTAPLALVTAVRNALGLPEQAALDAEGALFRGLVEGVQSRALRHLFAAERDVARIADVAPDGTPRAVQQIGVIGAGTMGRGITMALADAGLAVTLVEADGDALARGMEAIAQQYQGAAAKGRLSEAQAQARRNSITPSLSFEDLARADLVIEAAFEDIAVKQDLFRKLDAVARPGALLATNTSYLDVDAIAAVTGRPQDVLGLHFFSPAHVMKLLEIVRARETSADAVATALMMAKRMGKVGVVVGVCHGFVGNRMLVARNAENEAMLLEGALPQQIDAAYRSFGWPMGPFQMSDLAGLDIGWRNRKAQGLKAPVADWLCEQGLFGQKSGVGFYRYEAGRRAALPNPDLVARIEQMATERNVVRREFDEREILERSLLPMVNEGRRILKEGIARREADIDLVWVHGYGFPRWKGGPMFWAAHQDMFDVDATLAGWFERTGRPHFAPI